MGITTIGGSTSSGGSTTVSAKAIGETAIVPLNFSDSDFLSAGQEIDQATYPELYSKVGSTVTTPAFKQITVPNHTDHTTVTWWGNISAYYKLESGIEFAKHGNILFYLNTVTNTYEQFPTADAQWDSLYYWVFEESPTQVFVGSTNTYGVVYVFNKSNGSLTYSNKITVSTSTTITSLSYSPATSTLWIGTSGVSISTGVYKTVDFVTATLHTIAAYTASTFCRTLKLNPNVIIFVSGVGTSAPYYLTTDGGATWAAIGGRSTLFSGATDAISVTYSQDYAFIATVYYSAYVIKRDGSVALTDANCKVTTTSVNVNIIFTNQATSTQNGSRTAMVASMTDYANNKFYYITSGFTLYEIDAVTKIETNKGTSSKPAWASGWSYNTGNGYPICINDNTEIYFRTSGSTEGFSIDRSGITRAQEDIQNFRIPKSKIPMFASIPAAIQAAAVYNNELYVISRSSGGAFLYKSGDSGNTWTLVNELSTFYTNYRLIATPNALFMFNITYEQMWTGNLSATDSFGNIMQISYDGGVTWARTDIGVTYMDNLGRDYSNNAITPGKWAKPYATKPVKYFKNGYIGFGTLLLSAVDGSIVRQAKSIGASYVQGELINENILGYVYTNSIISTQGFIYKSYLTPTSTTGLGSVTYPNNTNGGFTFNAVYTDPETQVGDPNTGAMLMTVGSEYKCIPLMGSPTQFPNKFTPLWGVHNGSAYILFNSQVAIMSTDGVNWTAPISVLDNGNMRLYNTFQTGMNGEVFGFRTSSSGAQYNIDYGVNTFAAAANPKVVPTMASPGIGLKYVVKAK